MSSKMEYTREPKTWELWSQISRIVFGGMSFGDKNWQQWIRTEEEGLPVLKYAFDRGINTWDVADTYSNGESERIIGKAIKKYAIPRAKLVLMTKCYMYVDPDGGAVNPSRSVTNDGDTVNLVGLSRKHIFDAVDSSIERLGTYIDVLQIHRLDRDVPPEEIMKALNDIVESGKVRYIGASTMATWEFQRLQNIAEKNGWHKFISMQGLYNLLNREDEREMIPFCKATGVGLMPWSPLSAGILTHPWADRSDPREKSDVFLKALFRGREEEADKAVVGRLEELSQKKGVAMAQIAIAWVIKKGGSPICGLENAKRIDQAIDALSVVLSEEDVAFLEEPYVPKPAFFA